jgi:hypothetical protein
VQVSAPTSISVLGPQVASSATGAAAVTVNEVNLDAQAIASASLALAPPHGAFSVARPIPGAQEVLAIAYSGSTLELLTASGPRGQPCCSVVQVIRRGPHGGFGSRQTLVNDAGGGTTGTLVPLANGRMLAVIAAPQRLWASETSARGAGRFGPVRGLTRPGSAPAAVAVSGTPEGGSAIVWTQGSGGALFGASAGPGATPSRPRVVLTLPSGHAIDGVQLAPRSGGFNLVWTESWNVATGGYRVQVFASDVVRLGQRVRPRALSPAGAVASGLALSGNAQGAEAAAWDVCSPSGAACVVESRLRAAASGRRGRVRSRWFGGTSRLGGIDAGESAVVSTAGAGGSLIGWITGGRVALGTARRGAGRFGPPRMVSGGLADDLELGYGPSGEAVAAWTQGTVAPGVFVTVAR